MDGLQGKAALVTGASGGIGAAVARRLHEAGARVAMLSRRGDDLGVVFALTRPRSLRLMTTTFRPMNEGSWG